MTGRPARRPQTVCSNERSPARSLRPSHHRSQSSLSSPAACRLGLCSLLKPPGVCDGLRRYYGRSQGNPASTGLRLSGQPLLERVAISPSSFSVTRLIVAVAAAAALGDEEVQRGWRHPSVLLTVTGTRTRSSHAFSTDTRTC